MDFGGAFEVIFRWVRRFILVVWAKKHAGKWAKRHPKGTTGLLRYRLLGKSYRNFSVVTLPIDDR